MAVVYSATAFFEAAVNEFLKDVKDNHGSRIARLTVTNQAGGIVGRNGGLDRAWRFSAKEMPACLKQMRQA